MPVKTTGSPSSVHSILISTQSPRVKLNIPDTLVEYLFVPDEYLFTKVVFKFKTILTSTLVDWVLDSRFMFDVNL